VKLSKDAVPPPGLLDSSEFPTNSRNSSSANVFSTSFPKMKTCGKIDDMAETAEAAASPLLL
jgi:hypothetical protein